MIKAGINKPTVINIHGSEATFKNESNSVQLKKTIQYCTSQRF